MIALLVILLIASATPTVGNPVDGTTTQALDDCYRGMDTKEYRCVPKDDMDYLLCDIEAIHKCKCAEGLVCKREAFVKNGAQQCVFQCVIEDPRSYGMKNIQIWDENMERIFR